MKRLTVFEGGFWLHKGFPPVEADRVDEFIDCVKELAARLAAYEDTGLDPEEIEQLKQERDAAIEDLSGQCKYCLNEKDCVTRKGPHWNCWEWRGVQKER